MEFKRSGSIYDSLKKSSKTNAFTKINSLPYYAIREFSHVKALLYSEKQTADNMSESVKVYEAKKFEKDLIAFLEQKMEKSVFLEKYRHWDDAIPMLAKPLYKLFKSLVKNHRINAKHLYYLAVDLTTKSDKIAYTAIGILMLSQFQNDISEEILQTLSKHCRLTYYCILAISEFDRCVAITSKMISNLNPNSAMIAALILNYSVESNIEWLFEYAIPRAKEMSALSFKALTDPYIKKALSELVIDEENFSVFTKIICYGISNQNMVLYSLFDANFISELLLKTIANLHVDSCSCLSDQWFIIMAMHIFTGLKDQLPEIEQEMKNMMENHAYSYSEKQWEEIKRNLIKERIFVHALLHNDYLENLYHFRMPTDITNLDEDGMQEFIDQISDWIETEEFSDSKGFEKSQGTHREAPVSEKEILPPLYFNEEIRKIYLFVQSIFEKSNDLNEIGEIVMHGGRFDEHYFKLTEKYFDEILEKIDDLFRNEGFLDLLLDEIQFSDNKPTLSLPILLLFNIIPEFPYFYKMLKDYPLSDDFLNFCLRQFEYYHQDLCEYLSEHIRQLNRKCEESDLIFTNLYIISEKSRIETWVNRMLLKYIESEKNLKSGSDPFDIEQDEEETMMKMQYVEPSPDFLCDCLPYVNAVDLKDLMSLFRKVRHRMNPKHFDALFFFVKNSDNGDLKRKIAGFLKLTQLQIKNSHHYTDAILKYKNNQNGTIIKLPKNKK